MVNALKNHVALLLATLFFMLVLTGTTIAAPVPGNVNLSCNSVLSVPGTYTMQNDTVCPTLVGPQAAITISASDITLDCNGHHVTGKSHTGWGVYVFAMGSSKNVTVKNCNINKFKTGLNYAMVENSSIENVNVYDNDVGVQLDTSSNNQLKGVQSHDNTFQGVLIQAGSNDNTIDQTTINNWGVGVTIIDSDGNTLTGSVSTSHKSGVLIIDSDATLQGLSVSNSVDVGIDLSNSTVTVDDSTVTGNDGGVLSDSSDLTINNSSITLNNGKAIEINGGKILLQDNWIKNNNEGVLVEDVNPAVSQNSITGNTICANGGPQFIATTTNVDDLQENITGSNEFCNELIAVKQKFYAYFKVLDTNNSPVDNATVKVYDYGSPVPTLPLLTTNSSGETDELLITSFILDNSGDNPGTELRAVATKPSFGTAETRTIVTDVPSVFGPVLITLSGCGITITNDTTLTNDINCSRLFMDPPNTPSAAITIGASDVTLDCDGHSITNGNMSGWGIYVFKGATLSNITIKNCEVNGFKTGIETVMLDNGLLSNDTIDHNDVGVSMQVTTNTSIIDSLISYNTFQGVVVQGNSQNNKIGGDISNNEKGIFISSDKNKISSNSHDNIIGLYLYKVSETEIQGANIHDNTENGLFADNSLLTSVKSSRFHDNSKNGVLVDGGSVSITSTTFSDEKTGIYADECVGVNNSSLENNTFRDNTNATVMHNTDVDNFTTDYLGDNSFSDNKWTLIQEWNVDLQVNYQNITGADNASYSVRTTDGTVESSGVTDAFGTASLLVTEIKSAQDKTPLVFTNPTYFHAEKIINSTTKENTSVKTIDSQTTVTLVLGNFSDQDGDGVKDSDDNCVATFNPDQASTHGVSKGDACYTAPPSNGGRGGGGGGSSDPNDLSAWTSLKPSNPTASGSSTEPETTPTTKPKEPSKTESTPTPKEEKPPVSAPESTPSEEDNVLTGAVTGKTLIEKSWPYLLVFLGLVALLFIAVVIERRYSRRK